MKLNNTYDIVNYAIDGNDLMIELSCTYEQASEIDESSLVFHTQTGDICEMFVGYIKKRISYDVDTKNVTVYFTLDTGGFKHTLESFTKELTDAKQQIEEHALAIEELGTIASEVMNA